MEDSVDRPLKITSDDSYWVNPNTFDATHYCVLQRYTEGLNNYLMGCSLSTSSSEHILMRVQDPESLLLLDSSLETLVRYILSKEGCAKGILATYRNGLCYGYIPGNTLNLVQLRDPNIGRCVRNTSTI